MACVPWPLTNLSPGELGSGHQPQCDPGPFIPAVSAAGEVLERRGGGRDAAEIPRALWLAMVADELGFPCPVCGASGVSTGDREAGVLGPNSGSHT